MMSQQRSPRLPVAACPEQVFSSSPQPAAQPPHLSPRTHEPSTSMKMKVFRMLVVCFFQELQSSSSFRPIASRVEASGDALFEEGREGGKRGSDRSRSLFLLTVSEPCPPVLPPTAIPVCHKAHRLCSGLSLMGLPSGEISP